jgi:hypothetical protein
VKIKELNTAPTGLKKGVEKIFTARNYMISIIHGVQDEHAKSVI